MPDAHDWEEGLPHRSAHSPSAEHGYTGWCWSSRVAATTFPARNRVLRFSLPASVEAACKLSRDLATPIEGKSSDGASNLPLATAKHECQSLRVPADFVRLDTVVPCMPHTLITSGTRSRAEEDRVLKKLGHRAPPLHGDCRPSAPLN